MRAQAETGEVPQAVGRIEEWMESRMRRHRLPENDITQRYSTGRWIQIIERKMSDGGTVGIRVDITELKKGESERLELEAQLHHSQKLEALGTLAGGIAHDLNNTLVPVVALSKTIAKLLDPASRAHGQATLIHQAALRATDLVKQIVAFSRKQTPEKRVFDLAAVARETIKMMRASIPSTIRFETALAPVPPMLGDPGQLHQVILNLVTNAAQAIGAKPGRIQIGLVPVGQSARGRVFERFFSLPRPATGKRSTGLGLAFVREVAQLHGGSARLTNHAEGGAVATLSLPKARS